MKNSQNLNNKQRDIFLQKLGLVFFLFGVFYSTVSLGIESHVLFSAQRWPENAVTDFQERYSALAIDIKDRRTVGFYGGMKKDIKWWGVFNLSQYVLAPVIVKDSLQEELVICEFFFLKPQSRKLPPDFDVVRKYSDSLFLLKGKKR